MPADLARPADSRSVRVRLPALTAIIGLLLVFVSGVMLWRAGTAVERVTSNLGRTPITVYRPVGLQGASTTPVVVLSHGFAGSQQLMISYAQTLARRGYLAVTFDYLGHGRHPDPLTGDITRVEGATQMLLAQTAAVVDYAMTLPGSSGELAILGHSMASDIIARYAGTDSRVAATVAISMFSTAVTAESPANLLVIVGDLEGFLKREALQVLGQVTANPRPGMTVGNPAAGSARRISFAPGVEHVGVLYSVDALDEAGDWMDAVFARSGGDAIARRGPGIAGLLLGMILLAWPLARLLPRVSTTPIGAGLAWRELAPAALAPALLTPLLLMNFPADFMSVLVGGYLAVHFLVYGLVSASALWWIARKRGDHRQPIAWSRRNLWLATAATTLYLAAFFALALDTTVTSFAITPARIPLVLATLAGTLVYFLSDEWMAHGAHNVRGAHLFTRCCFLLSLGLATALSFEELFFLAIIAAVIVIYFLVYGLFSRWIYSATGHPAVGAVANAVSVAWALGAVFPFIAN